MTSKTGLVNYDENGLATASFSEIKAYLKNALTVIYGNDINIEDDTPDGILINVLSELYADSLGALHELYASLSREGATGIALDNFASLNNIARRGETNSTADVTLDGIEGTVINNGLVKDINGIIWELPESVTIENDRLYTATSTSSGAIFADANTITEIVTPVAGWTAVTNPSASNVGYEIETDAQLRYRIKNSFNSSSKSIIDSLKATLQSIENVNDAVTYENDTDTAKPIEEGSATNIPAHSIACVLDGGSNQDIAIAIKEYKTPGVATFGDITVNLELDSGTMPINFFKSTNINIYVNITIKKLSNFITDDETLIKETLVTDILNLKIGNDIYSTDLVSNLALAQDIPSFRITSIKVGTVDTDVNYDTLEIAFNQKAYSEVSMIQIIEA